MTNAEALAHDLSRFQELEDEAKETIADYIACPSFHECAWDGKWEHHDVCTACKVRWLGQEWSFLS